MNGQTVLCLAVTAALWGCAQNDHPSKTDRAKPPAPEENAQIDDALNAQLEALGYFKKGDKRPTVKAANNPYENVDLSHFLEGIDGTFVFYDLRRNIQIVENPERAETRFSPCSTFKIPNTLISLETGAATGPMMEIKWDQKKHPKEKWWDEVLKPAGIRWDRDHTLQSAFQNSCVWYFKELAETVGADNMQTFLNKFDYGNKDISGGIDSFWLASTLKISALEQVAFLKKLVRNTLPISKKTKAEAFQVFERENKDGSILYAKTGGGNDIGWFVGFIEHGQDNYIFAFNMAGTYEAVSKKRVDLSIKMLQELGVWF